MRELAQLLNEMQQAGIILDHALFGATAQMRYTEPVATFDAAVLVAPADPTRLDVLSDIYTFCAAKGYQADGEAITVGAWSGPAVWPHSRRPRREPGLPPARAAPRLD